MPKHRGQAKNIRSYKKALFIVCEGEETEPNYFEQFIAGCNFRGKPVRVQVVETEENTAKELVKRAKELKEIPTDEVWAVFDKDGYTKHAEAFNMALGNQIKIAFSSISFEYWILLHFEYTTRPFRKADDVIKYIEKKGYFDKYDKGDKGIYQKVKDNVMIAFERAKRVRSYQDAANPGEKIYRLNPYTNVDELMEAVNELSTLYT